MEISYLPKPANFEMNPVWDVAAQECERVANETSGDMLVFMPGAYEIGRTVQAIQNRRTLRSYVCFPLHGELPPEQQDLAVKRSKTRKIIVSTNVAETSLTIDGVTAVIDSGLARMARFDAHRGINTLLVEKISVASADQRAGRAGRTAPGVGVRLWTEHEHSQRALQQLPEVKRLDLAEVVLTLKAGGIIDVAAFPWIENPDTKALVRAETLLADLGALAGPAGQITAVGRKMLHFPLHPRYARMLLEAQTRGCVRPVALMAALTQGRNFLRRGISKAVEQAREDVLGEEHESDFPNDYRHERGVVYDESAKRVVVRHERKFRDLVLETKSSHEEIPLDAAAALLSREVLAGRIKLGAWDEAVEQWIIRVNRLTEWFPELEVSPIAAADRHILIEQICHGEVSAKALRNKAVMPVLREWLTAEQLAVLDLYLPERLTMANGRKSRLVYHQEGPPILSARIQELYGIKGKFTLGQGRVPVKIQVLAPNQRPIQVTHDLSIFWSEMYPKVKAELSRRYPRHEWR